MKKRVVVVTTLTCFGAIIFIVWRYLLFDSISPWNGTALCNAIQVGMTESEVEAILGRPADGEFQVSFEKVWWGRNCAICVYYDYPTMKVHSKEFFVIEED